METGGGRSRLKLTAKVGMTMLVLGAVGLLMAPGTFSAFSGTTSNDGNSFQAGTVTLSDSDGSSSMFVNLSGLKGGDTYTRCIKVTYTGSLDSTVRLYGSGTGGLGQYLDLRITRGSGNDAFPGCTDFTADNSTYVAGHGNGVIYNGTVTGLASTYADGVVDPVAGTPETWSQNEGHVYKFEITVQDDNNAQGQTRTQAFTWEARNI